MITRVSQTATILPAGVWKEPVCSKECEVISDNMITRVSQTATILPVGVCKEPICLKECEVISDKYFQ